MKKNLIILILYFTATLNADDWNAQDYIKNSKSQQSHAQLLLSGMNLRGDEYVLDIGCGDGRITEQLANQLPLGLIVGVDPSESMVIKALERANNTLYHNYTIIQDSAQTVDLKRQFDHVVAIHVMHWIKDQQEALTNIYNHVKPGGQFHLVMSPSKEGFPFHTALQKTINAWSDHFTTFINPQQVYDIETYRNHLVQAGFHIDALHYVYYKTSYEDKEAFTGWVRQWLPHAKHLPTHLQEPFLNEFTDNFVQEIATTSKCVPYGEYVLVVHATKV